MRLYSDCIKKSRYASEARALFYAAKVLRERGIQLRSYYCRYCMGFHLTKTRIGTDAQKATDGPQQRTT